MAEQTLPEQPIIALRYYLIGAFRYKKRVAGQTARISPMNKNSTLASSSEQSEVYNVRLRMIIEKRKKIS